MPVVTFSGLASGIDTDAIVEKLLNVEGRPIKKLITEKKKSALRRDALKTLGKHLDNLSSNAKDLYGFRASYNDKQATSSNSSVLEAIASRKAINGEIKIEVIQTASTHKISTDQLEEKKNIPSGKFQIEVNGESYPVKFRGGKLSSLKERIDEEAGEIVNTNYIKTSDKNYVMTIESKISGEKGEIKITGDKKLLKSIGLVTGEKEPEKDEVNLVFDNRYFTTYMGDKKIDKSDGNIVVSKDGKKISIRGLLWQEYLLPMEANVKEDTRLEFKFSYNKKEEKDKLLPFKVELGPEEPVNIKGIILKGYNISRIRPLDKKIKKKFDTILGVGVVTEEKGKRLEKIYPVDKDAKGIQEIPIGKDFAGKKINRLIFYTNVGVSSFFEGKITTPVKDKKGAMVHKNVIAEARKAKFKIDGIEVTRDKNKGISDVIKGVTLNLKSKSKKPVELKIEPDIKKAVDKILKFVEAYNAYIEFHRELIRVEKIDKPLGNSRVIPKRGFFVGDMTIIRLENSLRRVVGAAYPNVGARPVRLLTQMGISTGKVNASWQTIKEGKLVVDEPKLKKTIQENPEGVMNFFGLDTDADNRVDDGMAFAVIRSLKPYVSFGRNILSTKIDLEKDAIQQADERISKLEVHLESYEKKLKRKFGRMERAISKSKNQGDWLNNSFGNRGKKEK